MRILQWSLGALLALAAVLYGGDDAYVRLRMRHAKPGDPFESLTRTRVLAIPQKNGRYDYQIDRTQPTEQLTCVHSLFPHFGDQPCWYLKPRLNEPLRVSRGTRSPDAGQDSFKVEGGTKRIRL